MVKMSTPLWLLCVLALLVIENVESQNYKDFDKNFVGIPNQYAPNSWTLCRNEMNYHQQNYLSYGWYIHTSLRTLRKPCRNPMGTMRYTGVYDIYDPVPILKCTITLTALFGYPCHTAHKEDVNLGGVQCENGNVIDVIVYA